jgi:hypothetical protein
MLFSNLISGKISEALIGYLGDYVKPRCFNADHIKTEFLKERITLRNLELKEQIFELAGVPTKLERGIITQLTCTWSSSVFFGTEPVTLSADKVFLIFRPQNDGGDLELAYSQAKKLQKLEAFDNAQRQQKLHSRKTSKISASGSSTNRGSRGNNIDKDSQKNSANETGDDKRQGFFARLLGKLLANLRVNITNVHIRFEDAISAPHNVRVASLAPGELFPQTTSALHEKKKSQKFAIGIMLKSLKLHSTNSLWQEQIVEKSKCYHKVFRLEEFAVYLDPHVSTEKRGPSNFAFRTRSRHFMHHTSEYGGATPTDWRFMEFSRASSWMPPLQELMATASQENNDGRLTFGRVKMNFPQAPHRFILYPADLNVQLRVNDDEDQPDIPKQTIQVVSHTVLIGFDDEQYRMLLYMSANAKCWSLRQQWLHIRPKTTVTADPTAWWRYAGRVILKQRGFSARHIAGEVAYQTHMTKARKKYIALWVQKKVLASSVLKSSQKSSGIVSTLGRGLLAWAVGDKRHTDDNTKLMEDINCQIDALENSHYLRFKDIVMFRSLANHRLILRMRERELKRERKQYRTQQKDKIAHQKWKTRRRRNHNMRNSQNATRVRSSAESSCSELDSEEDNTSGIKGSIKSGEKVDQDNENDGGNGNSDDDNDDDNNVCNDINEKVKDGADGSGIYEEDAPHSRLYRWTAGWIWGKKRCKCPFARR